MRLAPRLYIQAPGRFLALLLSVLSVTLPSVELINLQTTLLCHPRHYQYRMQKPDVLDPSTGAVLRCSGVVTVRSCWGRCDSSEIGDFMMPFRISYHPVCTYSGRVRRVVRLEDCPGYPDPTVEVFDASDCNCQICDSDITSCENLNG
ncbi:hypothetical protein EGW08_017455 [Elysia chlorotica]|uniref:Glycoprotein hormone subunit beta domain-containing protein n=1 Tax=Elysia chlorotica TaxID=188477 RepID=A0A3S0ZAY7_ELYCH|nr:hypothetical protein EGW08_017455 [Elysia chlorotica]